MFRKTILLLISLILLACAACAPAEPQADFASEQVCEDLVLFIASVETLQDESNFADQTELQAQFDVVRRNFNNLVAAVQNLETAEKEDFENAVDELMNTASSLPQDASVPETIETLQAPINDVRDAAENLRTGLECQP
ncbi:MAG TPA: hypothetical protein VJ785_02735 [Anaerolineales bacterium]|nr:hypothetical protein [Anaerolineales bacterium]